MKMIATLGLTALIAVCVLLYAVDYLVWRYKPVTGHGLYGTVTLQFLLRHSREKPEDGVRLPTVAAGYLCECVVSTRRILALLVREKTSRKGNPDMNVRAEEEFTSRLSTFFGNAATSVPASIHQVSLST
jgi:hypothetical protein